jgi:hypothetical protein
VTGVEAVLEAVVDGQTQVLPWIELEVTMQDVEIEVLQFLRICYEGARARSDTQKRATFFDLVTVPDCKKDVEARRLDP